MYLIKYLIINHYSGIKHIDVKHAIFSFLFFLLSLISLIHHSENAFAICGPFHHPPESFEAVKQNHPLSVILISIGNNDSQGTAFLIDKHQGLFLTARHVVKNAIGNSKVPIKGYFEDPGKKEITLQLIDHDPQNDVALLKSTSVETLSDISPLELSFDYEPCQTKVDFLGTAFSEPGKATVRLRGEKSFSYNKWTHRIEIGHATRPGDSGAPVIKSEDGLVIGIIVENITTDQAVAIPIPDISAFLEKYAKNATPSQVLESLIRLNGTKNELIDRLTIHHAGCVSNFHLLGALSILQEHANELTARYALLDCPLYYAAHQRELGRYASKVYRLLATITTKGLKEKSKPEAEIARVIMHAADNAKSNGDKALAINLYKESLELLEKTINIRLENDSNGYNYFSYANNKLVWNKIETKETSCEQSVELTKSDTLAAVLHDYSSASIRINELSNEMGRDFPISTAINAAGLAVLVSKSKSYKAQNYHALGYSLAKKKKYKDASEAYAAAWKNGLKNKTILHSYGYVRSMQTNKVQKNNTALKKQISGTNSIPTNRVLKLLNK